MGVRIPGKYALNGTQGDSCAFIERKTMFQELKEKMEEYSQNYNVNDNQSNLDSLLNNFVDVDNEKIIYTDMSGFDVTLGIDDCHIIFTVGRNGRLSKITLVSNDEESYKVILPDEICSDVYNVLVEIILSEVKRRTMRGTADLLASFGVNRANRILRNINNYQWKKETK